MFVFYVMCSTHQRINYLITDYFIKYPDEIISINRVCGNEFIVLNDKTKIKFLSETAGLSKLKGRHEDIYLESSFREMYQV